MTNLYRYDELANKIMGEMDEYKKEMLNQSKEYIFSKAWEINIMNNYYYFLTDNGIDSYISEELVMWLDKHERVLNFILGECLSWDLPISEDWDEMSNFLYEVYRDDIERKYYDENYLEDEEAIYEESWEE